MPVPPIVSTDKWDIAQSRLSNNKHVKPTDDGLFTLQGLVKCGFVDALTELNVWVVVVIMLQRTT
jgi:hypothetical protein